MTTLLLPVQSVGFERSQRVPLRSFLIEALPDASGFIVPTDQVAANWLRTAVSRTAFVGGKGIVLENADVRRFITDASRAGFTLGTLVSEDLPSCTCGHAQQLHVREVGQWTVCQGTRAGDGRLRRCACVRFTKVDPPKAAAAGARGGPPPYVSPRPDSPSPA